MRNGVRLKQLTRALLPAVAVICAIPVAAASAHGDGGFGLWHHGFWADDAAVAGTVTSAPSTSGSFGANAYLVTPGAGNSSTTPSTTAVTITVGTGTKVITTGQAGITVGDDFYAVYEGVPAGTPLATLAADTPTVVYAYAAPTPEVEVKGVVTTAPAANSDSFTATAYVVEPEHFFPVGQWGGGGGGHNWSGGGGNWGGGSGGSQGANDPGYSYSYGGSIGGDYGYSGSAGHARGAQLRGSHLRGARCLPDSTPVSQGTPNTMITTDSATKITIDGQTSAVGNLAVGDYFTAVYDGTPDQSLSTITSTMPVSIDAWAPFNGNSLYAFVGTVTGTDTTTGTVSVNVTSSIPNGLFSGTDTFDVGSQTIVLGNAGSTLFGSLGNVKTGDVVAGGLIAPSGESASTVESTPLQVLVDFPQASTPTSSSPTQQASIRRAERRALKLLRREKAKYGTHKKK